MKLTLRVISYAGADVNRAYITLNRENASLGRKEDNALVLPDPKRYISGHHALIEFRSPDYFIKDTSVNGVLINDAKIPLGKGNRIKLNDGDRLKIGDYLIEVKLEGYFFEGDANILPPISDVPINFPDDPFAELNANPIQSMIDKNELIPSGGRHAGDASNDPFEFPANPIIEASHKNNSSPEDFEHIPPYKEAFSNIPPTFENPKNIEPASKITDDFFSEDWYKAGSSSPSEISRSSKTSESKQKLKAETKPNKHDPFDDFEQNKKTAPSHEKAVIANTHAQEFIQNFLRGAQLEQSKCQEAITPETFFIIGTILRAAIQGAMDVLDGRAKIKNEMHLDVTLIRSKQNNPIKFSVSSDEALFKLLVNKDAGYMPPKEAIEEAFDDIRAHQFSVIAGMQTALLAILKRFDPQKLEERLQRLNPISANIPIQKQAKLWELFEQLYEEIEQEAQDNFYHLFGQAFAETYEQQMQKIKSSKKSSIY